MRVTHGEASPPLRLDPARRRERGARPLALVALAALVGLALSAMGCARGDGGGVGSGDGGVGLMDAGPPRDGGRPMIRADGGRVRLPDAGGPAPTDAGRPPRDAGSCEPSSEVCNAVDDDCDGEVDECPPPPNGTSACVAGACALSSCASTHGDCDGVAANGCETPLGTDTSCGACGDACAAGASCMGGVCGGGSGMCGVGESDCDGDAGNGCEVDHTTPGVCASAENLGSACADVACGFACGGAGPTRHATRTGTRGAWFRAATEECSTCCADLVHTVRLRVPAGVDYDLVIHASCGEVLGSAPEPAGTDEALDIGVGDDCGGSDSGFDYWIEVVHRSGASCTPWTLEVDARMGC